MATVPVKLTPADHGRRMSLADFEFAEGQDGYLYELGRGVIAVSEVPNPRHLRQVLAVRKQLTSHEAENPGQVFGVVTGSECKVLIPRLKSERHPDLAVYRKPPPGEDSKAWRSWVPELIVEVVSPGSEERDYDEKRGEYLAAGVREYWIIDAAREEMLVPRRHRGRWSERVLRPGDVYRTRLLPGLEFAVAPVFRGGGRSGG